MKTKYLIFWRIGIAFLCCELVGIIALEAQNVIYVNKNATGDQSGSNWDSAYTELWQALENVEPNTEIWLTSHTYKPACETCTDRDASFVLPAGVAIIGGFSKENPEDSLELRQKDANADTLFHKAILSGNIGDLNSSSDNSYHVVTVGNLANRATLEGLFIQDGNADGMEVNASGGGIYSKGDGAPLKILDCTIKDNVAKEMGGGIFNESQNVNLEKSRISSNVANSGGGLYSSLNEITVVQTEFIDNESTGDGGGAYLGQESEIRLEDCLIKENKSIDANGGGIYIKNPDRLIMARCSLILNFTSKAGGAIYYISDMDAESTQETSISNCWIFSNSTTDFRGSVGSAMYISNVDRIATIKDCHVEGNFHQSTRAKGGAVYILGASTNFENCTFMNNKSPSGGAVYNEGVASFNYCTFQKDTASNSGGGIFVASVNDVNAMLNLVGSSFSECNSGSSGGAIRAESAEIRIDGSTFYGNSASSGGGISIFKVGSSNSSISNSTFSANVATQSGGAFQTSQRAISLMTANTFVQNQANSGNAIHLASGSTLTSRNSLFAENQNDNAIVVEGSTFKSEGYNLFSGITLGDIRLQKTDIVNPDRDIGIDVLKNNGGPTKTHALLKWSPALDKGEPIDTTAILTDQRGFSRFVARNQSDFIDIGAYERHETFVSPAEKVQLCVGEDTVLSLITIADRTGGAWAIGNATNRLVLAFPEGISMITDSTEVIFEGEGIRDSSFSFDNNQIHISYQRLYTTQANFIRIVKLRVKVEQPGNYFLRIHESNDAIQFENGTEDSVKHASVIAFPFYAYDKLPYEENFEMAPLEWRENIDIETPIWKWTEPGGEKIKHAASGESAMITSGVSPYTANIHSWLYSPCFFIDFLDRPMISMNIQSDTEEGLDGTVLQISSKKNPTWRTVGEMDFGKNWYNSSNILAKPGDQNENGFQYGWTGRDSSWRKAAYALDAYQDSSSSYRFRMAFRSYDFVNPLEDFEGFAFDDVFLGERPGRLLLESFLEETRDLTKSFENAFPNDIVILNYASSLSPFYNVNKAGPRARALFYGISKGDRAVLDGNDFNDAIGNLSTRTIDSSSLAPALFKIRIDSNSNQIHFESTEGVKDRVAVYVAIVEDVISAQNDTIINLLRKFMDNPGGTIYPFWPAGKKDSLQFSWTKDNNPPSSIVQNYDSLSVIVIIQNLDTKEVYQVLEFPIWTGILSPDQVNRQGGEEDQPLSEIRIYPNPFNQVLSIQSPHDIKDVKFTSLQGKQHLIDLEQINPTMYRLRCEGLAPGVYFLRIITTEESYKRFKLLKN